MIAIRLPEHIAVLNQHNKQQYQLIEGKSRDVLVSGEYVVVAGLDKSVKVYKDCQLQFTLQLMKKVKRMTIDSKNQIVYICDKHGDMWSFKLGSEGVQQITKDSTPIQTNLAIPKSFEYCEIEGQQIIILGDSYCKIKVYNANIIDQLIWIWVPFEGFLKQVLQEETELTMLFKRFDEHENHYFEIYKVKKAEFFQEFLPLRKVFGDNDVTKQAKAIYLAPNNNIILQYNFNKIQIHKIEGEGNTTIMKELFGEIQDVKISNLNGNEYIVSLKAGAKIDIKEAIQIGDSYII